MKKIPLTVKIPCILEMVVSGLFIFATLWFFGRGGFVNFLELFLLIVIYANGVAAFYCMKGNAVAKYTLMGLKVLLCLYVPIVRLILLLWGYLFFFHKPSREYLDSAGQADDTASTFQLKKIVLGAAGIFLLAVILAISHNLMGGEKKRSNATMEQLETISSLVNDYKAETGMLPADLSVIKQLNDPKARLDEWGSELLYYHEKDLNSYSLGSPGPDSEYDTEDDIVIRNVSPTK